VWRHSTPFAPLREKSANVLQAYNSPNLSVSHPHPKESGISGERCVKTYVFAVFAVRRPGHVAKGSHLVCQLAPLLRRQIQNQQFLVVCAEGYYVTAIR